MKSRKLFAPFVFLFLGFEPACFAAPAAVIEALQIPAWVQREDIKTPLKPGMEINTGEMLITEAGSRLLIKLADGSYLKIGENSQLDFQRLQAPEEDGGIFEANIHLLQGSLRYTTPAEAAAFFRNMVIQIGSISLHTRGADTDLIGNADNTEDNLVLIKGQIRANRKGEPDFAMNNPLSWYQVPHKKPARHSSHIPRDQLAKWAAKTELLSGGGVISREGRWGINLISLRDKKKLRKIRLNLAHQGFNNSVDEILHKGEKWYRLSIKGFESKADAEMIAQLLDVRSGPEIKKPWVLHY